MKRRIVFHSWRHFYAAMLADRTDLRNIQIVTGHKSVSMAAHYASHQSEKKYKKVELIINELYQDFTDSILVKSA